jgi:hypothetical protein
VEELLEKAAVSVVQVGEREISAHCPFHEDRHPSFSMNKTSLKWICFQCGRSGTLISLLQDSEIGVSNVDYSSDTKTVLRAVRHSNLSVLKQEEEPDSDEVELDRFYVQALYESFSAPPKWACEERLFPVDTASVFGVRCNKGWVLPIKDPVADSLLGWQFKRLDFVNNFPKGTKKSRGLFGLQEARDKHLPVALVESPLDVLRLYAAGITAVSSFGAMVSNEQISLLVEVADEVWLALDADKAGQFQTERLYPKIARKVPTRIIDFSDGCKDPGDMTDEQVRQSFS